MTLSNQTLANRFIDGADSGSSSRMDIQTFDVVRAVVGYGWAVYACDLPVDAPADVALFGDGYASDGTAVGWAGYSSTTTKHMQVLKGALERRDVEYVVVDRRLKTRFRHGSGDEEIRDVDLAEYVREHAVDALEYTGKLYQKP